MKRALADSDDWRRGYEGRHGGLESGTGAMCSGRAFAAASVGREVGKLVRQKDVRLSLQNVLLEQQIGELRGD
jgi:hypothetical protein